jgi:hypothetical protein
VNIYILKQRILKAVKNTKNAKQKKSCFLEMPDIIKKLLLALKNNSYFPSAFSCFAVKDPKLREIFAPNYKDRIIHHLIIDRINPFIDKRFIFDCFSNRKTKGTHMAVKRLQKFMHKENQYYLMADIKTFFPSIDKDILFDLLSKHIKSIKEIYSEEKEFTLNLSKLIIFQNPISPIPNFTGNKKLLSLVPKEKSLFYIPKNKGLPIGSLTSQFFANIYLNELDQFIKHKLKIKYYIRYVDDFVILEKDTKTLINYKKEIEVFLEQNLKLSLHPKKTVIQHKSKGINFLGYIVKEKYLLVRKRTVKSFKKRIYFFNHLIDPKRFPIIDPPTNLKLSRLYFKKDLIPPVIPDLALLQKMLSIINSYYGIFNFANSYNLRKDIYEKRFCNLKKYFVSSEDKNYQKNYKKIKINPAFLKDGAPKIR